MLLTLSKLVTSLVIVVSAADAAPLRSPNQAPRIVVLGTGVVQAAPDIATITFNIRGESKTAAAAAQMLVAKRAVVDAVLASGDRKIETRSSELSVREARDKDCEGPDDRLSSGECAILGYVAQLGVTVRMSPPADAGTVVASISQLGASDVKISGFELSNPAEIKRRAVAAALLDGRSRAEAIAAGSRSRLGALISVEDTNAGPDTDVSEIIVTGQKRVPPPSFVIVSLPVVPGPIVSTERLIVTYAILPN